MAQEQNISTQLNNLLVTRNFAPEMLDRQGKPSESEDAKTFTFDYVSSSGKNYGTMVVILDSENDMKVFYGDNLGRAMEGDDKDEFFDFQQHLSKFARMHRWTYTAKDLNQLKHTMQGLAAIQEGLFEGYYGTRRISYAGEPTEARLMIKHNRVLGEADARFRYVESLFIETADSQRFKLAFKNLAGGRAMLEHVRQGGNPYDIRGVHISEMVMEIATLSRFNRASASRMLEGTTKELVTEAQTYYKSLRENMKRMASPRGYNAYFETWHPATIDEQQDLVEDIKTLFIEQTLDTRIEAALPLLARIQQQGNAMKEAQIFENWINNLAEGTWSLPETPEQLNRLKELMATELIVGPDATNATEQLYDLIGDDILFDRLSELAERDPRANVWDDTEVMDRLEELGIQMSEPTEPGNPAEPATAPVPPVAAAPAAPVPVAEDDELGEGIVDTVKQGVNKLTGYKVKVSPDDQVWIAGTTTGYYTGSNSREREQQTLEKLSNELKKQGINTSSIRYTDMHDFTGDKYPPAWFIKVVKGQAETVLDMLKNNKIPGFTAASPSLSYPSGRPPTYSHSQDGLGGNPKGESIERDVTEGDGNPDIQPGMKVSQGTVVKVDGNTVTVKTSNGDMTMNIHDIDQAVAESAELNTMLKYAGVPVAESRVLDEAGETLDHILNRFKHEVKQFEQGGDLENDLYDALYDYYSDKGEIPYGIAKARTGDPFEWITDRLDQELGTGNHASRELPEADPISTFEVMSGFAAPTAEGAAVDAYMAGKSPALAHFADQLDKHTEIKEGSCNMTTEGEYCPEHGLMECGVYEMGTVAGGMAPVVGEGKQDPLVRLKSLALIK